MVTLKDVSLNTFHFNDFYDEWIKEIEESLDKLKLTNYKEMSEDEIVQLIIKINDLQQRRELLQDLKKASNESKIKIDDLEGGLQMLNLYNKHPERFMEV